MKCSEHNLECSETTRSAREVFANHCSLIDGSLGKQCYDIPVLRRESLLQSKAVQYTKMRPRDLKRCTTAKESTFMQVPYVRSKNILRE